MKNTAFQELLISLGYGVFRMCRMAADGSWWRYKR